MSKKKSLYISGSDRCFHIYLHATLVNASSLREFNLLWLWNFQKVPMFIFSSLFRQRMHKVYDSNQKYTYLCLPGFHHFMHLILSLRISYPYLIEFHYFADNSQEGMKHQMRGATQAQEGMTLRVTLPSWK